MQQNKLLMHPNKLSRSVGLAIDKFTDEWNEVNEQAKIRRETARKNCSSLVYHAIDEYMQHLWDTYNFHPEAFQELYAIVKQQAKEKVKKQADFSCEPLVKLANYGNIDWFAQPYFKGEPECLSNIIDQYRRHCNGTDVRLLSPFVQKMFWLTQPPQQMGYQEQEEFNYSYKRPRYETSIPNGGEAQYSATSPKGYGHERSEWDED
tara:strand:+ start:189 stop:806 length:618 start_codon:yes stop_codon:yes gene_type:complete